MLRWAHNCRINMKGPAQTPKSIQDATDRYRSESDFYAEFFNEKVVKTGLGLDSVSWAVVCDTFRKWMGQSYGWDNLPKKLKARETFETDKCFGKKLYKGEWSEF